MRITKMTDTQFKKHIQKKHFGLDLNAKVTLQAGKLLHLMYIESELMEEVKKKEEAKEKEKQETLL